MKQCDDDGCPVTLYVCPDGDDRWSGRCAVPSPDGADGPLASPRAALLAARRLTATGRPARIEVADGLYELDAPLVLTPADKDQVWTAAAGARPVFSGGRRLAGWRTEHRDGREVWTLELPEVAAGSWHFTQLWVNGVRRPRPRLPKRGFFRFAGLDGHGNSGFSWNKGPARAEYHPGDLRRFHNLDDVSLVAYQLWFDTHHRIANIDEENHVVHFRQPSLGSLLDEGGAFARYALFNVFEALEEPGEWYLDARSGVLHYLPMAGETPENTTIVAPRLPELLRVQGDDVNPVANIRFENLGLAHNEWSRDADCVGTVQAAYDVPGAVVFDRAEHCVLYGCEIAHCAGYGVEMLTGCHGNVVAACTIRDLGGGGIKIGHEALDVHEAAVGKAFQPALRWLRPMAATVVDCNIHDGGHVYPSAIGVWIGNAGMNRIQHNEIHHLNYTGISFGWIWSFAPTSRGFDNRIEYNHIHHVNHQRLLSDNGGIYSLGIQTGSRVVGNHIHDIACYHYGGWVLYPDEGSSGILYPDNCVHDIQDCGFSMHYGRFNVTRNNIFARMERSMLCLGREDLSCGNVFEKNLIWFDRGNLAENPGRNEAAHATRRNLVWNAGVGGVLWPLGSLAAEQAAGRWIESIEAEPLFADPTGGDFTLRADSPAVALGFEPFDWRSAGPRRRRTLPASFAEYALPSATPLAAAVAHVEIRDVAEQAGSHRIDARVCVRNPSTLPVAGAYRLAGVALGADGREWLGDTIEVRLEPGAEAIHDVSLLVPVEVQRLWLMARGDEKALFSGAALVTISAKLKIPRLPEAVGEPAGDRFGTPPQGAPITILHAGQAILRARAAVEGDALRLVAKVTDPRPCLNDSQPYNASSVELFVSREVPIGRSVRPYQFILIPPVDGARAELRALCAPGVPEGARYDASMTSAGWTFDLFLPLGALGVETPVQAFRLDLICNATAPVAGQNHLRLPVWGTLADNMDAGFLAKVTVGECELSFGVSEEDL